jgi:hypothetical protein
MPSRLVLLLLLPLAACERPSDVEENPAAPILPEVAETEWEEEASQKATRREDAPRQTVPRERVPHEALPRSASPAAPETPTRPRHPGEERDQEARAARTWKAVPADGKHAAWLQSQRDARLARPDCVQVAPAGPRTEKEIAETGVPPMDSFEEGMVLPGSVVW